MSAEMDALVAEVAATKGQIESAVTVIRGIAARIAAAGTDPAALAALTADLHASETHLADAIASDAQPVPNGGTPTGPAFNANDLTPNGSTMADGTVRNTPGADPANPMGGFNPALPITS